MQIEEYKEINKGALIATFNVVIKEWGLTIRSCTYFEKDSHGWVGFPSRTYDDPETGKKKYYSYIQLDDKVKARFESAVKEEVKKFREAPQQPLPDIFGEADAPF